MTPAAQRLLQSRERLLQALHEAGQDEAQRKSSNTPPDWISRAGTLPGAAGLLRAGLSHWWRGNPVQKAGALAAQSANTLMQPVAQKHPVSLVAGALVFGAALSWVRPWRWLPGTALLVSLGPQLLREFLRRRN